MEFTNILSVITVNYGIYGEILNYNYAYWAYLKIRFKEAFFFVCVKYTLKISISTQNFDYP